MPRLALLTALVFASLSPAADPAPPGHAARMARSADRFRDTVGPLLTKHCLRCHGGAKTEGGLDLADRDGLLKGGDSGPAAKPGAANESLAYLLAARKREPHMPEGGDPLPPAALASLAEWIDLGAAYDRPLKERPAAKPQELTSNHWSFRPVRRPEPPAVLDAAWPVTPADHFVRAVLESRGLRPAQTAEPRTLIRRLTFGLTGLPPSPEEVDAFEWAAARDPRTALERLADRLLASPAYGERWARHWLDLVRYCDSFDARITGASDMDCLDAWRYRDWVVNALNRDLPYDEFVRRQVAGDVLPLPDAERADGVVATGMLALGNWGGGDADKEKLLTDVADDQVDVVTRTFLGLTASCARCHDHKFDPVSTRDYYALAGVFFSTHILANVGPKTNGPPMLRVPLESAAEKAARSAKESRLGAARGELTSLEAASRGRSLARLRGDLPAHLLFARANPGAAEAEGLNPVWLRLARRAPDAASTPLARRSEAGRPGVLAWRNATDCPNLLANTGATAERVSTFTLPPRSLAVHPGPATDVAVIWTSPAAGEYELRAKLADLDPTCGDGVGWELRAAGKSVGAGVLANGGRADVAPRAKLSAGDRVELVVRRRGEYTCDTTGVHLTIHSAGRDWNLTADWLAAPPAGAASCGPWTVAEPGGALAPAVLAAWATWEKDGTGAAARALADAVADAGGTPFPLEPADADRAALVRLRGEVDALRAELAAPRPTANAAQEGGVPGSPHAGTRDVRVHLRGRYDRLGEVAPRGFPAAIRVENPPVIRSGSGRKELADWLTRPDHPLTARVIVNRVWRQHFGRGIVNTPSNFGRLGEPPSHPELLDFLASEFVADGWSLKRLHRRIVLSAAYRQSSVADPATAAADPDGRLFGRQPPRRLEAEALRDAVLTVSGALDPKVGGPSVRDLASPRRTLYLTATRSDRSGFAPLFDAADSTAPVDARTVSTVAPQALFLMNHPFVAEQAKRFAARVLASPGGDAERLTLAHRLALGRPPTADELAVGRDFLAAEGGGPAAWGAWCRLLFQTNEFATVD